MLQRLQEKLGQNKNDDVAGSPAVSKLSKFTDIIAKNVLKYGGGRGPKIDKKLTVARKNFFLDDLEKKFH